MTEEKFKDELMKEEKAFFEGWDFSYLKDRWKKQKPDWDYEKMAKNLVEQSRSVLDMGTGGGEIFSSFAPFKGKAIATEGYPPNYKLAKKRLEALGVKVVDFENASVRKMPFNNKEFDLVLNRHDAFDAGEVFRILKKDGFFLTQQVSGDYAEDLVKEFNTKRKFADWNIGKAISELKNARFAIEISKSWQGKMSFSDVGAIVYFLKAIPWAVEGFGVKRHFEVLKKLQKRLENGKKLEFKQSMFLIKARKI